MAQIENSDDSLGWYLEKSWRDGLELSAPCLGVKTGTIGYAVRAISP